MIEKLSNKEMTNLLYGKLVEQSESVQEACVTEFATNIDCLYYDWLNPVTTLNTDVFYKVLENMTNEQNSVYFYKKLFYKLFSYSDFNNLLEYYFTKRIQLRSVGKQARFFSDLANLPMFSTFNDIFYSYLPYFQANQSLNHSNIFQSGYSKNIMIPENIIFCNEDFVKQITINNGFLLNKHEPNVRLKVEVYAILHNPDLFKRILKYMRSNNNLKVEMIIDSQKILDRMGNLYSPKVDRLLELSGSSDTQRIKGIIVEENNKEIDHSEIRNHLNRLAY